MNTTLFNNIKALLEEQPLFSIEKEKDINFDFKNETILITGAAGTIGSGLSKLIAATYFKKLILIDNAETALYYVQQEFESHKFDNVHFVLADIRDYASMEKLMKEFHPTYIFHAAAYKHVPMMESNPYEAVTLNIRATKFLANLALKYEVKKFIFISTDKAANPISIMGMTKRICERYLDSLNKKNSTRFLISRFGNILGSNGSLLPLFKKQIDLKQPITVTSEEVSRYFISNKKACSLILKVATHSHWKHSLFTFTMGEPIKIIDLAYVFLKMNNFNIEKNIKIIGLRAGEKLHETFVSNTEILKPSKENNIFYIVTKKDERVELLNFKAIEAISTLDSASKIKSILETYL